MDNTTDTTGLGWAKLRFDKLKMKTSGDGTKVEE